MNCVLVCLVSSIGENVNEKLWTLILVCQLLFIKIVMLLFKNETSYLYMTFS